MISPARVNQPAQTPAAPSSGEIEYISGSSPYGLPFWLAYLSSFLVAVGAAILIRFGDFVTMLGGDELNLGWIVGVGMVGSLLMRVGMGVGIDRYGPRIISLGSLVVLAVICAAHLSIHTCHGPAIYLLRIVYCSALAGIYGASITFVASRAPTSRMAEIVGMIGTAGFLGNIVGTQLGDVLRGSGVLERPRIDTMFFVAAAMAVLAVPSTWLAMRHQVCRPPAVHPPMLQLLRRYQPGMVLLVVVAMGVGLNLPFTFLPTYAAHLGISGIALFFTTYAVTAVITRVLTRSWPQRLGLRTMVLLGSVGLTFSLLAFLLVVEQWHLMLPGIGYGMSHAVLFPATVAIGNLRFPEEHRGLGTTLILAMWDIGSLVGMPAAGAIVHYSEMAGLAPYAVLFCLMASFVALVGIGYSVASRPVEQPATQPPVARPHGRPRRKRAVRV